MKIRMLVRAITLCFLFSGGLFAQLTADGSLIGTVTDNSGGVLPNAMSKFRTVGQVPLGRSRLIVMDSTG